MLPKSERKYPTTNKIIHPWKPCSPEITASVREIIAISIIIQLYTQTNKMSTLEEKMDKILENDLPHIRERIAKVEGKLVILIALSLVIASGIIGVLLRGF